MKRNKLLLGVTLAGMMLAGGAGAQEIKRIPLPNSDFPILQAVAVPPGASTIYFSGILPEVSNKEAPKGSIEAFGDTETQTISVFRRIETALAGQGLTLGDVIQLKVFLVGDPSKGGKLDFAGFQAGYTKFFATKEQPNKPVRSAFQIAGLAPPGALIEIEATAAKVR
jgi:enamine deaminase RidA (YjgF/YER057c/UK114 family)